MKCSMCRFCLYDRKCKEMICHNEDSINYGRVAVPYKVSCCDFSAHEEKMPIDEALQIVTQVEEISYDWKMLYNMSTRAYCVLSFKSNEDLARWKDAITKLFTAHMKIGSVAGKFEDSKKVSEDYRRGFQDALNLMFGED